MTAVAALGTLNLVASITDRIQIILDTRGWSRRELSRRAGLAEVHVSKLLQRGAERAGADTLAAVARAGGVHLSWLMTGEGEQWDPNVDQPAPSGPEADPPSGEPSREVDPVLGTLPNWPALLAGARALRPQHPEWVWSALTGGRAWMVAQPTAAMVAELSDIVLRHVPPPAGHAEPQRQPPPRRTHSK